MSAIVVGVGPGLGGSLARRFSKAGYSVALVARKLENLQSTKERIQSEQGSCEAFAVDTTDQASVESTFKQIEDKLGKVEVLCYNVGPAITTFPPPRVEEMPLDKFKLGLETGVVGAFIWSKCVIPGMKELGKGTILFTGATAGLRGAAGFSVLSPGKFALRSLSQTLAKELGPSGIHVAHVVVDGLIYTERVKQLGAGGDRPVDHFLNPDAMAEEYYKLHMQDRTTWSQEMDLRPYSEKF
eukprot:TRINITY_DN619_c0_g1_i6.p2 TRINITY_DN619_c0_g1~~TRINITY_DN619_c0_g1_i6.p2  ORF type:complete len:241 (+),score=24.98 TRINITY_DN619_c0_g1_i6:146-868(+)